MQVEFTIRKYKPEDFLALWRIDQSCFAPEIAYSQGELKRYLKWQNSFTLVAENSSVSQEPKVTDEETDFHGIIGFVVADRVRTVGHIITIDVRTAARGQGAGSALLETAEAQLDSSGCRTVRLETAVDNLAALDFYKKHGYSVVRTMPRYYSNGVDALVLEKDLLSQLPSDNVQK